MISFRLLSTYKAPASAPVEPETPPVSANILRMAVSNSGLPNNSLYKLDNGVMKLQGNLPSTANGNGGGICFSPDSVYCAAGVSVAPWVEFFKHSDGLWSRLPNPGTLPTGMCTDISYSYDGKYVAVSHYNAPYLTVYRRDGDTFVKLPDLSPTLGSRVQSLAFSPKSNHLVLTFIGAPHSALLMVSDSGLTKLMDSPAGGPTWYTYDATFSPDGSLVGFAISSAPYYSVFKFDPVTGYGAKLTSGANGTSSSRGLAFSRDNKYMVVAGANTPPAGQTNAVNLTVFPIANDAIGAPLNAPAELLPGYGFKCAFLQDTYTFVVAHNTTPFTTFLDIVGDNVVKSALQVDTPTSNNGFDVQFYLTAD